MRTVRRLVMPLNAGKRQRLAELLSIYAKEKKHWLDWFARKDRRILLKSHRRVRDEAVRNRYQPDSGLPARLWKLALIEAAETWDKYWQSIFAGVRTRIAAKNKEWDDAAWHYANWLLSRYDLAFACLEGGMPKPPFEHEAAMLPKVAAMVRRRISRLRGKPPVVRQARSMAMDADCYGVFEKDGRQYIAIMSMERRHRLVLPLSGHTAISGNIRVVMANDRVEIHVFQEVGGKEALAGAVEAVDMGYSEVFMDAEGIAYGRELGATLTAASDARTEKGKARNRLRALAAQYRETNPAKARRIHRFNLGAKKWDWREHKVRASIACIVNHGLNQLLSTKKPSVLVTEDLRHTFTFDKPKTWNRRLSSWTRGIIQDRVEFKALAECFRHEQVNPAYSSQTCPQCGFVDSGNRNGDRFVCCYCGYEDHADRVGAMNLRGRLDDPEITRYTPYREVKTILLQRFHRRLEATVTEATAEVAGATVPGRTPETVRPCIHHGGDKRGGVSRMYPAVNRRAKLNKTNPT